MRGRILAGSRLWSAGWIERVIAGINQRRVLWAGSCTLTAVACGGGEGLLCRRTFHNLAHRMGTPQVCDFVDAVCTKGLSAPNSLLYSSMRAYLRCSARVYVLKKSISICQRAWLARAEHKLLPAQLELEYPSCYRSPGLMKRRLMQG